MKAWIGRIGIVAAAWALVGAADPQPSRQQAYDAAQAAFDRGDWTAAAAGFEPLLGKAGRVDGTIRSRFAEALAQLGEEERAETEAARAVTEFPGTAPDDDRAAAYVSLASIRLRMLDLTGAVAAYQAARAAAKPEFALRSELDIGEINAAMTTDPQLASRLAAALIGSTSYKAMTRVAQAQVLTLAARAKLNAGDLKDALAFSRQATGLVGAQSGSVNVVQAQVRGDAALIYLKLNRDDDARQALAFSGGGYMPQSIWLTQGDNDLPVCNDDLHPDDVAVIQFGISDKGGVVNPIPVYASRAGPAGAELARAIRGWSFNPQDIAKLSPFWRYAVRLEVRCLTRPASTRLAEPFERAAREWLDRQGATFTYANVVAHPDGGLAERLKGVPALRRKRPGGDVTVGWPILAPLLPGLAAPTDVRVYAAAAALQEGGGRRAAALSRLAQEMEALPGGARGAAWLRLEAALILETSGSFAAAGPLLEQVLAASPDQLDASDPIRLVATLHRALVDRKLGDAAAADARLARSGISSEQCALFDVKPLPVNQQVSSNDFPREALRWRMEGFAREAFDIDADGRVKGVRTVMAYPAFVFASGTESTISHFRYLPPTMNNVAVGCASQTQTFRYRVPDQ